MGGSNTASPSSAKMAQTTAPRATLPTAQDYRYELAMQQKDKNRDLYSLLGGAIQDSAKSFGSAIASQSGPSAGGMYNPYQYQGTRAFSSMPIYGNGQFLQPQRA